MGLTLTLILLAAALALAVFARYQSGRPKEMGQVKWIPWTTIMILSGVVALFMIVHVLTLLGVETGGGRPR